METFRCQHCVFATLDVRILNNHIDTYHAGHPSNAPNIINLLLPVVENTTAHSNFNVSNTDFIYSNAYPSFESASTQLHDSFIFSQETFGNERPLNSSNEGLIFSVAVPVNENMLMQSFDKFINSNQTLGKVSN